MHYVTYYRVSTPRQGISGLGMEAQHAAVQSLLRQRGGSVLAEYVEIESGKRSDNRPQLQAALLRCRQTRATLLVAKIDRLSRNAAFLLALRDSGQRFIAADMPDANELTVGILALVAQDERERISARTAAALAAAKARGQKLGRVLPPGDRASALRASIANTARARKRAEELAPVIADARTQGITSVKTLADHLNNLFIPAPGGGLWHPTTVSRLLRMLSV